MKTVAKITALFFLCITAMPLLFGVFYLGQQKWIKHEMKEALEKEQLTTIQLKQSEIVWYEEGKELQIGKEKFDVKYLTVNEKGIATIQGLFDKNEKQLDDMLSASMNKSGETNLVLSKIFFSVYIERSTSPPPINITFIIKDYPQRHNSNCNKGYFTIVTPPPQV